jgi:hypothetical protein
VWITSVEAQTPAIIRCSSRGIDLLLVGWNGERDATRAIHRRH